MKKLVLVLALAGFIGAGATPAIACEGGKCKMEHADKDKKSKKGKKAASAESCHMESTTADAGKTPSCCMKKDAKAGASKETKETKTQN
ncbi:hypothetical protein H8S95_05115 [Pontibacter sp. KCTC 32443]|uniref:hypothetical protein n=1 Tax=Pontibacter TaxID=323449 RepID=UPI00164CEE07|nr:MULTISPECIES: hypothetical protein [Pontibacter]MBC5773436.1 hypothetical protein [Pontibacter sp. KCTC 32443]